MATHVTAGVAAPPAVQASRRSLISPKTALVVADLATVTIALLGAVFLSYWFDEQLPASERTDHLILAAVCLPAWPIIFSNAKLYSVRFVTRLPDEFRRVARSVVVGTVLLTFAATVAKVTVPRVWIVLVFLLATFLLTLERVIARWLFSRVRARGGLLRPVVVVGGNAEALEIAQMLEADRTLGYDVRGFVDIDLDLDERSSDDIVTDTLAVVRGSRSTGVIVAATAIDLGTSNLLIRELTEQGIHVELSSTLRDIASHRLTVRPLGRFPVVYVEPVQRHGWRAYAKRSLDLVLACGVLLVASPLLLVAAIAIKLDDPKGKILFKQTRVGRHGKPFGVYKLRTMIRDAEQRLKELQAANEADGPLFKMTNDPRITRPGRILRKLSVDELPQLINVLRNDMSMVGPRPALPAEVEHWGEALHGRLRVKPGITGMWQVNGRSSSSFADYERLDLYYVDNWSLATDLAIVAKTVPAVLFSKGAY